MVRVSVIIVSYNSGRFLPECLASVFGQSGEVPLETILVDNHSTDGSPAMVRERFPDVRLIANDRNTGFARANNQGITESTGGYLLFLNPDTRLLPGALWAMVQRLDALPSAGCLGPRLLNGDGSLQRTGVSFPRLWNVLAETFFLDELLPGSRLFGRHRQLYADPEIERVVEYLQGSCLLMRREALETSGPFDEEYFMYFEENDLCCRLREHGWTTVYSPAASVVHYGGSGAGYYGEERLAHFHRSYLLYLKKHMGLVRRIAFRGVLAARALVRCLLFAGGAMALPRRRREFRERRRGYTRAFLMMLGVGS
jgi:GT2 family glycosyltransferase